MSWLNSQAGRVVPDHPLAAAAESVIGRVDVQRCARGQRLRPVVGVADKAAGYQRQPFVDGISSYLRVKDWLGVGAESELGVGSVHQRLVRHPLSPGL